jgi:hypothetical protein
MFQNSLKYLSLVLLLVLAQIPMEAFAQRRQPPPGYPPHGRDEVVERQIYHRSQGQQTLDLMGILGLNYRYDGRVVKSVIIRADTARGMGEAQLLVNRQPVGPSQRVGTYTMSYTFELPYFATIGRDVRSLEISLRGSFSVETVAVVLEGYGGGGGRPEVLETLVNQRIEGNVNVPLRQVLGLDRRYEGRRVEAVIFTARSDRGMAQAVALINGMSASRVETIDVYPRQYVLRLDGDTTLGRAVQRLELNIRGSVVLERVGVQLSRNW